MSGVRREKSQDVLAGQPGLHADGYEVFVIPEGVESKAEFFDAVVSTFPLDPPLVRFRDVWDALDDSLSAGLLDVKARKLAVLWPDAFRLALAEPDEYEIATEILGKLAESLSHGEWTNDGEPKEIVVVLGTLDPL
jgi:hypothetical protein